MVRKASRAEVRSVPSPAFGQVPGKMGMRPDDRSRPLDALRSARHAAPEALREFAHILGTEETWLARLEQRSPRTAVWPDDVSIEDLEAIRERTKKAYEAFLAGLGEEGSFVPVTYTNSAGREFTTSVADILLHVVLHGQYHRGKVNLLLRQAGEMPTAPDYIAFVRGAPAATEATSRRARKTD